MALVPAICTQCGAQIEIDDTHEAGICKHCRTAFITEKAITNYNTYIINNTTNPGVGSLVELAKKELLIRNYSNANFYLDEIKKNSADSEQRISNLFNELDILEWAKAAWNSNPNSQETKELMKEITTYDSQNINVWLFMLETSFYPSDIISFGNKILMLSLQDKSEYYKEKVYEIYIQKEFDPKKVVSSVNLVSEIPYKFIIENDKLQSMLMENCVRFISQHRTIIINYQDTINDWCRQLQSDKRDEIQRILKNNKGCYIATCVYGSYDCPQVWTLRRFRDYTLDGTWYGRLFIKCYYAISPTLVKLFGKTKWFRRFWRSKLDKMVDNLNSKGIENTYYKDKY